MNLEQAFEIVDNALSQLQLTRNDHATLIKALSIIKEATEPKVETDTAAEPIEAK